MKWDEDDEDGSESTKLFTWGVRRCKTFELQAGFPDNVTYVTKERRSTGPSGPGSTSERPESIFTVHIC